MLEDLLKKLQAHLKKNGRQFLTNEELLIIVAGAMLRRQRIEDEQDKFLSSLCAEVCDPNA